MANLEQVMKDLNKKYKFEMVAEGLKFQEVKRIPFSSPKLNYMLYGGLPIGRLVEFAGTEGSGKTTTALDVVKNAQELFPEKKVLYIDVERTLDSDWAKLLGVNVEELLLMSPGEEMSAEAIFEACTTLVETGEISVCVIDSLGAMVSAQAYSKTIEDRTYGGISMALTQFSKEMIPICARTGCLLIGINQVRDDMNSMYGGTTTTGGRAWRHNCSVRVQFRKGDHIDERGNKVSKSVENPAGHNVNVVLVKSKICKMDRKISSYVLRYLQGIDYLSEYIDVGIREDIIVGAGAWFTVIDPETGEVLELDGTVCKFQGRANLYEFIKGSDVLQALLRQANETANTV